jgi:serine O-acetyltransferase
MRLGMTSGELRNLVYSDLYRHTGKVTVAIFLKNLAANPGFKYSFWMRLCSFFSSRKSMRYFFSPLARLMLARYRYKYGIDIPHTTLIGSGFYIGHFGGIVVNYRSTIGKNCNISPGVVLGQANRGRRKGYPVLGDNVYIGAGAKIIGNVKIGNNVAIGANCVVIDDIPNNAVVGGIPGRVLSFGGAEGYVNRIDY